MDGTTIETDEGDCFEHVGHWVQAEQRRECMRMQMRDLLSGYQPMPATPALNRGLVVDTRDEAERECEEGGVDAETEAQDNEGDNHTDNMEMSSAATGPLVSPKLLQDFFSMSTADDAASLDDKENIATTVPSTDNKSGEMTADKSESVSIDVKMALQVFKSMVNTIESGVEGKDLHVTEQEQQDETRTKWSAAGRMLIQQVA